MVGFAGSPNDRDHSATGRDRVYTGHPAARRLLADLLRTWRRSAVSDNIFTLATPMYRSQLGIVRRCAPVFFQEWRESARGEALRFYT